MLPEKPLENAGLHEHLQNYPTCNQTSSTKKKTTQKTPILQKKMHVVRLELSVLHQLADVGQGVSLFAAFEYTRSDSE